MDAVELPLPANVVVSELLGAADRETAGSSGYGYFRREKFLSVKLKRSQDSKRTDKKLLRASIKTISDPLTSKTGFTSSDLISGGNSILGIYGLRADHHDATKHVEELPLSELLDGSYNHTNLFSRKGKRASNVNEHILLSVKKACSVLLLNSAADGCGKIKSLMSPLNHRPVSLGTMSGCDGKDKCIEDTFSKVHETNLSNTSLYQPREILERLALPPSKDLQDLISSSSTNSVPSQSTMCMKAFQSTSLPPFPWSFSQSGTCKPGLDSGRLASTRNMCQGKWFRIGSYSTSTVDDENCFSDPEMKALGHIEDSINQQKVDDLVQDVKKLTESMKPRLDVPHIMSESVVRDNSSVLGSGMSDSTVSRKLKLVDGHADSYNNHVEYDFKDHVIMETCEAEGSLRCLGSDLKLVNLSGQKDHCIRNIDGFSGNSYSSRFKSSATGSGPSSLQLSTPETSNPGDSPGLLAAAAILCEMASCSNGTSMAQNDPGRKIELPKAPLPNTPKACNSMASLEIPDGLFKASRHYNPIKQTDLSMKCKLLNQKKTNFTHMNNVGREPVKWSFTTGYSDARRKLENIHPTKDQTLLQGNSIRPSGLTSSPVRVGKVYDDQQKLRKAALKALSTALGGTYIKDCNRGRSKRW